MLLPSRLYLIHRFFPRWTWRGNDRNALYLTFDDGPNPETTPAILDLLALHPIQATFFCVGEAAEKYPELVERIESEGHQLGNHTYSHENGWTHSSTSYVNSIQKTQDIIKSNLFRPPYGKINFNSLFKIKALGLKVVMWSWLSYDFHPEMTINKLEQRIQNIKGGDILVFHDSKKSENKTRLFLSTLIPFALKKGYTFKVIQS